MKDIVRCLALLLALAVVTRYPPASARILDASQYVSDSTVDTNGVALDISAKAFSILVVNDGTADIYVEFGQSDASQVTSADWALGAGESLTVTREQDGAFQYVGLSASSGTQAYRVLAFY